MKSAGSISAVLSALIVVGFSHFNPVFAQYRDPSILGFEQMAKVDQYLETAAPDYYEKKQQERRKRFPVVIVIPGIMGSALIDHETQTVLWGEKTLRASYDPRLIRYPSERSVDVKILDAFNVLGAAKDVYGDALNNLSKTYLSDKRFINIFPYDWRQDNRVSANMFNNWYCDNKENFEGRNVIIAAHSMGGLITKYWIKEYYRNSGKLCPDGSPMPKLAQLHVDFIGVPHYGAPKALNVFSNGFYLAGSGNSASIFGAWIDKLDREWLANAINEYGFSFPSAYQLLPIYNAECFPETSRPLVASSLPPPFIRTTSAGGTASHEDIFSADLWEAMEWPRTGRDNLPPDYYTKLLPAYLRSAYNFLCDLANYDIPPEVEVSYYASNAFSTEASYTFDIRETGKSPLIQKVPGDETVPYMVAGDFLVGTEHHVLAVDQDLSHSVMLRSKNFWRQIEDEVFWAENRSQKAAITTPEDYKILREAYLQTDAVPTLPLVGGDNDVKLFAVNLAADLIKDMQLTPAQAYKSAKASDNIYYKNVVYSSVAELAMEENPRLSVTAANSLTHVFIENSYWDEAVSNAEMIKKSPAWRKLTEPQEKKLKGYVLNNDGWAKLKAGNVDGAKASFEDAIRYGSRNAINGLNELKFQTNIGVNRIDG